MKPGEWRTIDHSKKLQPNVKQKIKILPPTPKSTRFGTDFSPSPSPMPNKLKGFTSKVIPGPPASMVLPPRDPTAEELNRMVEAQAILERTLRRDFSNSPATPKPEQMDKYESTHGDNPVYGFRGDETPTQHESASVFNPSMLPPTPGSTQHASAREFNGSETPTQHASALEFNPPETPTQRASALEFNPPETPTQRLSGSGGGKRTRKKYNRKSKKRKGKSKKRKSRNR